MSNNFNLAVSGGGLYISKAGHDSNAGTSADEPKKSLSALPNTTSSISVLGAGYYTDSSTGASGSNFSTVNGDGFVIINLNSSGIIRSRQSFSGIKFIDGSFEGANISGSTPVNNDNCIFINISGLVFGGTSGPTNQRNFTNCILSRCRALSNFADSLYKVNYKNSVLSNGLYQGSSLINCYVGANAIFQRSHVAADAVPSIISDVITTSTTAPFVNNNINGLIRLAVTGGWQDYAIQDQYTGTPQDNGYPAGVNWLNETNLTADGFVGTVSGWNAVVATCINRDPEFINSAKGNFNLQTSSPHIKAGFNGDDNIGGTEVGQSILVTDDGVGSVTVILGTAIDDSVPDELRTTDPQDFVRIISYEPRVIENLKVDTQYLFDSDYAGGNALNNNVPDSEPLTTDYATYETTIASGSTTQFILDNASIIAIGNYARIDGEVRECTNVEANTPIAGQKRVTAASAFRATVGSAAGVTWGTQEQIAVLNPNRLTIQVRTSNNDSSTPPTVDGDWDNNVSSGYGVTGDYFNQEINTQPGLYIITGIVYGAGDSNRPSGGTLQEIGGGMWVDRKIWLRNNFSHKGL